MPIYEIGGSDKSFTYNIHYSERNGNWKLEYIEVVRNGRLAMTKDYFEVSDFSKKVETLCYAVEECEALVYMAFPNIGRLPDPSGWGGFHA